MRAVIIVGLAAALALAGTTEARSRKRARPAAPAYVLHISSHLAENAKVSIDGRAAVMAPGYGAVTARIGAGKHVLSVTSPDGVNYKGDLILAPTDLFAFEGKSYWCVNLLETELQPYSMPECQEDVSDRG
jgi:hypothetical protein